MAFGRPEDRPPAGSPRPGAQQALCPDGPAYRRKTGLIGPPPGISEYTNHVVYIPGISNMVADALSNPASGTARKPFPRYWDKT